MKKITKKTAAKSKGSTAKRNLEVKPVKGAAVRGGGWDVKSNKKY